MRAEVLITLAAAAAPSADSSHGTTVVPSDGGFLDMLVHQSVVRISLFGVPPNGYRLSLGAFLVLLLILGLVTAIVHRLIAKTPAALLSSLLIAGLGAMLFSSYIPLPGDFRFEDLNTIGTTLGALLFAGTHALWRSGRAAAKAGAKAGAKVAHAKG